MSKKRKLDASQPIKSDDVLAVEQGDKNAMGGFWGGSALNMLKAKLEESQASLGNAVMQGVLAIELEPTQIRDETGSDRLGDWQNDEDFQRLVADIKRRGQQQPIRVRPADPDWTPDAQNPLKTDSMFYLQSGRRRLAAMKTLGLPVLAVISTDKGEASLADIEERFLENTMRKDLTGFEQLLSIGMIARRHQDLTQVQIAERLQVPQGDVSLGLACDEYHAEIMELVDVKTAPKRVYREILPKIKRGQGGDSEYAAKPEKAASQKKFVAKDDYYKLEARPDKNGFTLKVQGFDADEGELQRVVDDILNYFHVRSEIELRNLSDKKS